MNIRIATLQDVTMVLELCRKTFYDTWTKFNTDEDINAYMNEFFTEEKVKEEIQNKEETYLVAFIDEVPSGYVKLRRNYKEGNLGTGKAIELQRIYVHEHLQGKGIGQALLDSVIEIARKEKFGVMWLGVWERNSKAIELYKRYGFGIYDDHYFTMGNDKSHDWLMRKFL